MTNEKPADRDNEQDIFVAKRILLTRLSISARV